MREEVVTMIKDTKTYIRELQNDGFVIEGEFLKKSIQREGKMIHFQMYGNVCRNIELLKGIFKFEKYCIKFPKIWDEELICNLNNYWGTNWKYDKWIWYAWRYLGFIFSLLKNSGTETPNVNNLREANDGIKKYSPNSLFMEDLNCIYMSENGNIMFMSEDKAKELGYTILNFKEVNNF